MKKSTWLAVLLCCALVLACSLALVACQEDEQGFEVSVTYDKSMGSVTLSAPKEGKLYDAGEQVTVTVNPNSNCVVAGFQVSGHLDAMLSGNSYTFEVTSNTIITVVFAEVSDDQTYTVTLRCDEGAQAYLTAQQIVGNVFVAGSTVTLHVTVEDGFSVESVYIDSRSVQLDTKGEYSFVINSNVTITIYVNKDFGDEAYNSLKGNVRFDGIMTELRMVGNTDTVYLSNLTRVYDPTNKAVQSSEYIYNQLTGQTDVLNFVVMQGDDDGYLNVVYHDIEGKVHRERAVENGMYVPFSNVQNPFEVLSKEDFYFDDADGSWQMVDKTLMGSLVYQLTGYYEDVESVRLYEASDGVHVEIVSNIMTITDNSGNSYYAIHSFDMIATGINATIDPDLLNDYPMGESQHQLVAALAKAQQATSYRVTHEENGSLEGAYVTFRTDKAVWSSGSGIAEGYAARPDGSAWLIELNEQGKAVVTGTAAYASSLDRVCASFDLGQISPSMFVKDGDGVYRLRDADISGIYGSQLAVSLASAFATGSMEKNFATLADNVSLVVRNGELVEVKYVWSGYDEDYSRIAGVATLTFEGYNTTSLPVELEETSIAGIVDSVMHGAWFTPNGSLRLDISYDYVLLDGAECDSLVKVDDGIYTFSMSGVEYTFELNNEGKLLLKFSGETLTLERRVCDWYSFVGNYHGESGAGTYHNSITVNIEIDTITVTLVNANVPDGVSVVFALTQNEEAFVFNESINGASEFAMFDGSDIYYLTQVDRDGKVWLFSNYLNDISMYIYRDDTTADLSVFTAGTYRNDGDDYVVTIGNDGITFVFQGDTYEVEEVYVYQMLYSGRYVLYFKADMFLVEMQQANEGTFWLHDHNDLWPDENSTFILSRDGYSDPWDMFNADYVALNGSGDTMKIDASGITFIIDGKQIIVDNLKFYRNGYVTPRFTFTMNGTDYILSQWGVSGGYFQLSATFTQSVLFAREGYTPNWSVYEGVWYGEDGDGTRYDLDLTGKEFKFSIDGVLQVIDGLSFDEVYFSDGSHGYQFDFFIGGTAWSFSQRYNEATGEELVSMAVYRLKSGSASATQVCILWKDKTVQLTTWRNLVGEWSAEGYTVKVTENSLTVSLNGVDMPVTNLKCYSSFDYIASATIYQFQFDCDGHRYVVQPSSSGERINLVILGNDGEDDRYLVLPVSNYTVPNIWKGWIGYYESSATSGDKIAVSITSDGIFVSLDAGKMTLATITYYDGSEQQLYILLNEANYRINLNDWGTGELYLVFMDEYSHILHARNEQNLDWTQHVVDGDFVDNASGWAVRVKKEQLFVRVAGQGDFVQITNQIGCAYNSNGKYYSLNFSLNGQNYSLDINDARTELTLLVGGDTYTLLFDEGAVYDGIFPEEYIGTWSTTSGDYVIVVNGNSLVINGDVVTDITVEILNYGQTYYYNFDWNGMSCSISFFYSYSESKTQLTLSGAAPSDKWALQETLYKND